MTLLLRHDAGPSGLPCLPGSRQVRVLFVVPDHMVLVRIIIAPRPGSTTSPDCAGTGQAPRVLRRVVLL
jgi:hypothetical protein